MTHAYKISGMTCSACVSKVKSELLKLGDVLQADIQLANPQAVITMSKHIATATLQKAISNAGNYVIAESDVAMHPADHTTMENGESNSYYPVFLIFAYITGISLLFQLFTGSFNTEQWLRHFMAGFFLVFSFFKLLNIRGFAEGYSTYDVVARAIPAWGFIYPFVELLLAILFFTGIYPLSTNIVTLIVMGVSLIGVVKSLLKKAKIQCACLGTVIRLPLGKVTLFEDLLMIVMSAVMIILIV